MNSKRLKWLSIGVLAAAAGGLLVFLVVSYPEALRGRDGQIGLVHGLAVLAFVGAGLAVRGRFGMARAVRYGLIWIAAGLVLLGAYSFRYEFADIGGRMLSELMPDQPQTDGNAVVIRAGKSGHFVVAAEVDGATIRFLVDTGASDVVLTPRDAARLGFDLSKLSFSRVYRTANGNVRGAPVRLGRIAIGPVVVEDVRASVNGAEMNRSLLGMSFLNRLGGYEVSREALTLRR